MNNSDEFRRNAQECQRMADNARNPTDKASWLGMIKNAPGWDSNDEPRRPVANEQAASGKPKHVSWPNPSDEDSQASH